MARWVRGLGNAALLLAVVAAMYFVVDWCWEPNVAQRVTLFLVAAVACGFGCWRWTWPWLRVQESELDIALLVERREELDSDLVAALQFATPEAANWGSPQLATAVVEYVAEYGREVPIRETEASRPALLRAVAVVVFTVIVASLVAIWPYHGRAFVNRLLLGAAHYPRQTVLERLTVNGQVVDIWATVPVVVRTPYGQPVDFVLHANGRLPTAGRVELRPAHDISPTVLPMPAESDNAASFAAHLPRLVDSVAFQAFLGDAWTEPCQLVVVPLPIVTVALSAEPPAYAAEAHDKPEQASSRQLAVVEGTSVTLDVECANKQLRDVTLRIADEELPLAVLDQGRRRWRLAPAGTPMAAIVEPLRYEIQVTDEDGLTLAEPIQGLIRIRSDRPPRVTAAIVTQYVLPSGKPRISYGAVDDYGVARMRLLLQVVHEDGSTRDDTIELPAEGLPRKAVQQRWPLDLGPLKLQKGDQVKCSIEATDFRGTGSGRSTISEPLVLTVTDERGVLAAMAETDQRTARQMDAIIQRQLGIGD
jgi:hypothetical protein